MKKGDIVYFLKGTISEGGKELSNNGHEVISVCLYNIIIYDWINGRCVVRKTKIDYHKRREIKIDEILNNYD